MKHQESVWIHPVENLTGGPTNGLNLCSPTSCPSYFQSSFIHRFVRFFGARTQEFCAETVGFIAFCTLIYNTSSLARQANTVSEKLKNVLTSAKTATQQTDIVILDKQVVQRRNIVKMLIVCVSVFFLCYTPMVSFFLWGYEFCNIL